MIARRARAPLLVAAALFAACGDTPSPPKSSCPGSTANEDGVGKPCASAADCAGLHAASCPAATTAGDLDFCTMDCALGWDLSCGSGARCAAAGKAHARCVPAMCYDALVQAPVYPKVMVPCTLPGPVNALGVGRNCQTMADCQDVPARTCPMALHPSLPNWCSLLCDTDADCGANAFCWVRPSFEGGLVGSCAPVACRLPD